VKKQDERIAAIIQDTKRILFDDPPFEMPDDLPCHHVYPFSSGYEVQLSLKNVVCRLGYFNDKITACRFADLATYRWEKYRKAIPKYNFSITQAKIDTMAEDESGGELANFILAKLHVIFSEDGLLVEKSPGRLKPKPMSGEVAELKKNFEQLTANLQARINGLEERIAFFESNIKIYDNIETPKNDGAILLTDNTNPPPPTTLWTIETQNPPTK
jgi:hypothetical protein